MTLPVHPETGQADVVETATDHIALPRNAAADPVVRGVFQTDAVRAVGQEEHPRDVGADEIAGDDNSRRPDAKDFDTATTKAIDGQTGDRSIGGLDGQTRRAGAAASPRSSINGKPTYLGCVLPSIVTTSRTWGNRDVG